MGLDWEEHTYKKRREVWSTWMLPTSLLHQNLLSQSPSALEPEFWKAKVMVQPHSLHSHLQIRGQLFRWQGLLTRGYGSLKA